MTDHITLGTIHVAREIHDLVMNEIAPGTGITPDTFWSAYQNILRDLAPLNRQLLETRDDLQTRINEWFINRDGQPFDVIAHKAFLEEISYIEPDPGDVTITTKNVDPEIGELAGPQLVVPVSNARFALNAANARWGSLYDALYGTDAIRQDGNFAPGDSYNPTRGATVVARAAEYLDAHVPLEGASHAKATAYTVNDAGHLVVALDDGSETGLVDPDQFAGMQEEGSRRIILLRHNGLHIEIIIDPEHPIGKKSAAGVCDVVLEAALTTIQDCEDSVAAIDAEDKAAVYRNWLGLMRGDLADTFDKGGKTVTRTLAPDRTYQSPDGNTFDLPGRSVMLVRHVGHLMTTNAVTDTHGRGTPEGILDAMICTLAAMHDLKKTEGPRNSRTGSIYVVKPKMHGPQEAAFANTLFDRVEDALGLARNTIKIGVMDEERRTSLNLKAVIAAVKDRLVFINTGFLDRTGDEIHTAMHAGPVVPKNDNKNEPWLNAYEANNVQVGLAAGLKGRAQIGKGMWAKPEAMAEMLETKAGHPRAGATTAWVPSPTAAVLHALHYHEVDVAERQVELARSTLEVTDDLLIPPLMDGRKLSEAEITRELDNNCQSILGYVVRWVDQGIGCSKVPDISDVSLMEDRATLRISSQQLANWLLHGLCTQEQVMDSLMRMARAVDRQNQHDPVYRPMAPNYDACIAFQAAADLIFEGATQPSGYTEPTLHRSRKKAKAGAGTPRTRPPRTDRTSTC